MNERLLNSWVAAVTNIRNNRFLDKLSLNEMVVIRELLADDNVTASRLCDSTGLLKSQMNHILETMEKKDLIIRDRSGEDKRKIRLTLSEKGLAEYEREHARIALIVDKIEEKLGSEKVETLSELLMETVKVIREDDND